MAKVKYTYLNRATPMNVVVPDGENVSIPPGGYVTEDEKVQGVLEYFVEKGYIKKSVVKPEPAK